MSSHTQPPTVLVVCRHNGPRFHTLRKQKSFSGDVKILTLVFVFVLNPSLNSLSTLPFVCWYNSQPAKDSPDLFQDIWSLSERLVARQFATFGLKFKKKKITFCTRILCLFLQVVASDATNVKQTDLGILLCRLQYAF